MKHLLMLAALVALVGCESTTAPISVAPTATPAFVTPTASTTAPPTLQQFCDAINSARASSPLVTLTLTPAAPKAGEAFVVFGTGLEPGTYAFGIVEPQGDSDWARLGSVTVGSDGLFKGTATHTVGTGCRIVSASKQPNQWDYSPAFVIPR